ncbi:MAG TPA: DUF6427 family protein [Flavobacterium sp.]|jgi:hypothetical protein
MITSLFRKSTPLNYGVIIISLVVFFFLYHINNSTDESSPTFLIDKLGMLLVIFASLFTANFVIKRNGLSKDSTYSALFLLLYFLFFPTVLDNPNLLISNFFILLALRRLISLYSLKATKEKIFDASLWIFAATLFHFWSILFIILVFISILFHVSRDYRNWVLPFLAAFAIGAVFILFALVVDQTLLQDFLNKIDTNFRINYFTDTSQNLALSIFASVSLFFTATMIMSLSARPQALQSTYIKIVSWFVIGVMIYIISPGKSNDMLIFTFAPLAFMATSHIEFPQQQIKREITLAIFILCSLFLFFYQL